MNDALAKIIEQALEQAPGLCNLDGPRAEAWASDLVALAIDSTDPSSAKLPAEVVSALLASFDAAGGLAGTVAAASVRSVVGIADPHHARPFAADGGEPAIEIPAWLASLSTSTCDGAWIFANRRGQSAVFRFMDSADVSHTVAIDLVPGSAETIGEVAVGPADVVQLAEDPDSEIDSTPADPEVLAERVAAALAATTRPRETLVVNGWLLMARLSTLIEREMFVPRMLDDVVPELPEHDPDDDTFALSVLSRALGADVVEGRRDIETPHAHRDAVSLGAASLRRAAELDAPEAQWLAASRGPVDLDDADLHVVVAALSACVRPCFMAPLDAAAREAVGMLEWADWLGVVIGLVGEGADASVDPAHMVDLINRCPEVTSTIPKADRGDVERSLAVCTELWHLIGLVSDDRLTPFGVWILPQVLAEAWRPAG